MDEAKKHYTRHKTLHIVQFHLYEISMTGKFVDAESRSVIAGAGSRVWLQTGMRELYGVTRFW